MDRHIFILSLALACQVRAQVLVDNFDPRVPRPGATLLASLDPFGWSRPLPPSIDPLGVSYRPAHASAVLPALYDPLGTSRPGSLPFALDPIGYTKTDGIGYGGSYGAAFDSFLARPSGFLTGVGGSSIFPDPNAPVQLGVGRVPGTPLPTSTIAMPVIPVNAVPVRPLAPISYPAQVSYPAPVSYPVPVNPVNSYPVPSINAGPAYTPVNLPYNIGGLVPTGGTMVPGVSSLPLGNEGLTNLPSSPNLPNSLNNLPNISGTVQLGTRPLNGGSISGGFASRPN